MTDKRFVNNPSPMEKFQVRAANALIYSVIQRICLISKEGQRKRGKRHFTWRFFSPRGQFYEFFHFKSMPLINQADIDKDGSFFYFSMVMAETEYLGDPFTLFFYHVSTYSKSYKTNSVFCFGYYLLSRRGEKSLQLALL